MRRFAVHAAIESLDRLADGLLAGLRACEAALDRLFVVETTTHRQARERVQRSA